MIMIHQVKKKPAKCRYTAAYSQFDIQMNFNCVIDCRHVTSGAGSHFIWDLMKDWIEWTVELKLNV